MLKNVEKCLQFLNLASLLRRQRRAPPSLPQARFVHFVFVSSTFGQAWSLLLCSHFLFAGILFGLRDLKTPKTDAVSPGHPKDFLSSRSSTRDDGGGGGGHCDELR